MNLMSLQMLGTLLLYSIGWSLDGFSHGTPCRTDPFHGEKLSLLVLWAVTYFPHKRTTLFPKDVVMRTSCCSVRYRQGQVGGIITSTWRELPAASAVPVSWLSSSCSQGIYATQHSPEGHTVWVAQYSAVHLCLLKVSCYMHHYLLNVEHSPCQFNTLPKRNSHF